MTYFIKQFAEAGSTDAVCPAASLGTATETKSIEGSDQDDNSTLLSIGMGTKTFTMSIEGIDQDPHGEWLMGSAITTLGTGTMTESVEGLDQDRANGFF